MNPSAAYWDTGIDNVPTQTGAAHLLDAVDVEELAGHLGLELFGRVLDVGCGTGRIARLCDTYVGADISSDAVAYCRAQGLDAQVIDGPADLPDGLFDLITALSVFTHISHEERRAYLERFCVLSQNVLVDILPGDSEQGGTAAWPTRRETFEALLAETGWLVIGTFEKVSAHGHRHLYFRLTR